MILVPDLVSIVRQEDIYSISIHYIAFVKISAINKLKFTENKGRINDSKTYSLFLTTSDLL